MIKKASETILLTGGNGTLGNEIIKLKLFDNILCSESNNLDITNQALIENFLYDNDINIIIHSAALARMRSSDENPYKGINTNIIGTSNLVRSVMRYEELAKKKIRLIHISTDAVYSGITGNYSENDATIPYNNYGWSKLGAECAVRMLSNHVIIRTRFFNPDKIRFENAATDIYTSSITVNELAKAIKLIVFMKFNGTINIWGNKISDFNLYKNNKRTLTPCKRSDIVKQLKFQIAKDSSMNCALWHRIKAK